MKVADKKDRRAHILIFNRSINFFQHVLQFERARQTNYIDYRAAGSSRSEPMAVNCSFVEIIRRWRICVKSIATNRNYPLNRRDIEANLRLVSGRSKVVGMLR